MSRTARTIEIAPGVFYRTGNTRMPSQALPIIQEGYRQEEAAQGKRCPRTRYHEASDRDEARLQERLQNRQIDLYDNLNGIADLCAFMLGFNIRQQKTMGLLIEQAREDGSILLVNAPHRKTGVIQRFGKSGSAPVRGFDRI